LGDFHGKLAFRNVFSAEQLWWEPDLEKLTFAIFRKLKNYFLRFSVTNGTQVVTIW
jgi:hypothetical protein